MMASFLLAEDKFDKSIPNMVLKYLLVRLKALHLECLPDLGPEVGPPVRILPCMVVARAVSSVYH